MARETKPRLPLRTRALHHGGRHHLIMIPNLFLFLLLSGHEIQNAELCYKRKAPREASRRLNIHVRALIIHVHVVQSRHKRWSRFPSDDSGPFGRTHFQNVPAGLSPWQREHRKRAWNIPPTEHLPGSSGFFSLAVFYEEETLPSQIRQLFIDIKERQEQ